MRCDFVIQLKKDYLAGVGDSFDLVVIGGYYGRGKRTSVYGAFLLACYDPESETYQAITKIGTGFSDEMLENHYKTLNPLEISIKKQYYDLGESKPDVFFEPKIVWEVLAADLSLSPVYSAAKGLVSSSFFSNCLLSLHLLPISPFSFSCLFLSFDFPLVYPSPDAYLLPLPLFSKCRNKLNAEVKDADSSRVSFSQ